jgi:predicted ATPase
MILKELTVKGFRSLKDVTWLPGRLNVVIGPNASGKSNLLLLLDTLVASAQGRLDEHILAAGGMASIGWDGSANCIDVRAVLDRGESEPCVAYDLELDRIGSTSAYRIGLERVGEENSNTSLLERSSSGIALWGPLLKRLGTVMRPRSEEETVLSESDRSHGIYEELVPLQDFLASASVYSYVRTDAQATIRQSAVARYETRVRNDGQNLVPVLQSLYNSDRQFKQYINSAMTAAFGEAFEELVFPADAAQRIQLHVRWKSLKRDTPAYDLSDGTLRFLFLMTVLASPNPPPLIAIDEPETGLHPSMFPIIAEIAANAAERTQVIFTTHSDQFLSAFRDVIPTVTVTASENGETKLRTIKDEELQYWLKDFTLGELYRSGELEDME